ncbi:basic salivary proline-rich protein 2-like [Ochotona curzoniae]|uniref:basic salivary proline-rich protein 2-like n=1 Tax=Ochotona curzoniae TaxID=130825 RepID=UPI001B35076E|nr:basic salivary proline-rich protein 2-like [Ochotona curzoniae]
MGKGVPQAGQQTSKRQPDAGGVGWVSAQGAPDAQTRPTGAQGAPAPRTPPPQPQTTATDPPPPTTQPGAARRGGARRRKSPPPHTAPPPHGWPGATVTRTNAGGREEARGPPPPAGRTGYLEQESQRRGEDRTHAAGAGGSGASGAAVGRAAQRGEARVGTHGAEVAARPPPAGLGRHAPGPPEGGDQGFETGTPEPTHGGTHGTPPAPPTPQQARPASHGPHRHGNNRRPLPPTRDTRRPPFRSPAGTGNETTHGGRGKREKLLHCTPDRGRGGEKGERGTHDGSGDALAGGAPDPDDPGEARRGNLPPNAATTPPRGGETVGRRGQAPRRHPEAGTGQPPTRPPPPPPRGFTAPDVPGKIPGPAGTETHNTHSSSCLPPGRGHSDYHRKLIGQTFEWVVAATEGVRSARGYLESPKPPAPAPRGAGPGRPADLGSATDGGVLTDRPPAGGCRPSAPREAAAAGKQELAETRPAPRAGRHRRAEATTAAGDDGEERRRRDDRRGAARAPPTGLTPPPTTPRPHQPTSPRPGGQRSGAPDTARSPTPRESQPEKPAGETGTTGRLDVATASRPHVPTSAGVAGDGARAREPGPEPRPRPRTTSQPPPHHSPPGWDSGSQRPDLTDLNPRAHAPLRQADPPAATPPATAARRGRAARHTGRSPSAFPDGRSGTRGAKHHRVTETRDRDTDEERDWRRTQQARQQEPPRPASEA